MIILATIADAKSIANILVETWKTGFGGIVKPEDSIRDISFFEDIMEKNIFESIENISVNRSNDIITGFISVIDQFPSLKIKGLYILPEFQRKGIGKSLLMHVLSWAKNEGFNSAYLNTLKGADNNTFYLNHGFVIDDNFTLQIGENDYPGVKFTKRL